VAVLLHDASGRAAPQGQVVFQAAGQQHRHRIAGLQAEAVQGVGGLVHIGKQLRLRPAYRGRTWLGRRREGEGGLVAEGVRAVSDELVGVALADGLGQSRGFYCSGPMKS
jgi:hypothetical protein